MYERIPSPAGLFLFPPEVSLTDLLPASFRTKDDRILAPHAAENGVETFLDQDLLVPRLNEIQGLLRICGRPMPPRPLHHQIVMSREIVVTEQMDMHLVWLKNYIFIKPLPAYLLHRDFWSRQEDSGGPIIPWNHRARCAWGFVLSYMALVAHRSDFDIAMKQGLLPSIVTWEMWKSLATQILEEPSYSVVNPRFCYGELRLSRLNLVYAVSKGWLYRGYSRIGGAVTYEDLLRDNFAALATLLGYVVIVLTAIQAGLATDRLQHNGRFQDASYGFTVFSIIAPLVGAGTLMGVLLGIFLNNLIATKSYESRRFHQIGVDPHAWNSSGPDEA
ncbi:hypothetical protein BO94DRAFT_459570 [Aspergillus sclerotioniger CBS 115572]|uniref:Uncharacterized protein n=1 Tax=Aspergillus sclerotioniger CBS 115572 TaxID=1450535 RepID=A0A317X9H8_9EURO|nr:hypothetical protein BO94DRAFT_459570 [Aspergillus sclerotioniger CBS 115572]PWY93558.1 hypothetical protein BO94DRAFT_459570 [Aspergillus sclerotioniger CBS 115572]